MGCTESRGTAEEDINSIHEEERIIRSKIPRLKTLKLLETLPGSMKKITLDSQNVKDVYTFTAMSNKTALLCNSEGYSTFQWGKFLGKKLIKMSMKSTFVKFND